MSHIGADWLQFIADCSYWEVASSDSKHQQFVHLEKLNPADLSGVKSIQLFKALAGKKMRRGGRMRGFQPFLTAILVLGSLMATGCAVHQYRTYDPYYNDYHSWNSGEDVYYRQWIGERHYDYVEYNRLSKDRQKEYWEWRHKHGDHDKDRDHDHDHDKH